MPELNPTQFRDVNPHQQALPGMEHLSHPWAGPLSRGYMLNYVEGREHELQAVDPSRASTRAQRRPAASLSWQPKTKKDEGYAPGEVIYVTNPARRTTNPEQRARSKGLAPALFHAAHYFNFGQSTVPIHSAIRTEAGEHFAAKVRPELRPDIAWRIQNPVTGGGHMATLEGKPTQKLTPSWNLPEDFHPYQQQEIAKEQATAARMKGPKKPPKGQGRLF